MRTVLGDQFLDGYQQFIEPLHCFFQNGSSKDLILPQVATLTYSVRPNIDPNRPERYRLFDELSHCS